VVEASAHAVDASGNIAVGGFYSGSLDSGNGLDLSYGQKDAFLGMYDVGGNWLWSRHFGGPAGTATLTAVGFDAAGHVFATGTFTGSIDFGGKGALTSAGNAAAFVLELDSSSGATTWSEGFGAPDVLLSQITLTTDAANNVLLGGSFGGGQIDFGCGSLAASGPSDSFLAQHRSDGTCSWSEHWVNTGAPTTSVQAFGLAVDPSNHVLTGGQFTGAISFGGSPPLQSTAAADAFLAKLDTSGKGLWSYMYGDPVDQSSACSVSGVAADAAGNGFVTGGFSGSVVFGDLPTLTSTGGEDIFVAKLSP